MNRILSLSIPFIVLSIFALAMLVAVPSQTAFAIDCKDGSKNQTDCTNKGGAVVVSTENRDSACAGIGKGTNCGDPGFFSGIVGTIVSVLTFIVGGISVIMLVIGGIRYAVSGGDPQGIKGAKDSIIYAIVGLVVAASAYLLVRFVIGKL